MATNLLSALECKNATSNGAAIRKLHDGDGLYLWLYADGRKYWRMRYWQHGKEKSLSVGVYPKVSLSDARRKSEEVRQHLKAGKDPSEERKDTKRKGKLAAENSFEAVALEWHAKQTHTWVDKHADDVKRRLEANIFPAIGKRPIAQITASELLAAVRKIESRGSYDLAHRVLQVAGQVFRFGVATGRCTSDPSPSLRGALTPHVKLHQAAVHQKDLPELLRKIATYDTVLGGDKQTRLALQLLAKTFVRTNELLGAQWPEFDLENAMWTVPADRMKMRLEHLVPLAKQSLEILAELKEISGHSPLVFPGRNPEKPISNNTLLFALYRLGYKGRMTGHGFRAVASTILNGSGEFDPDVIERQLAHSETNEIRGAYNRAKYMPQRVKMMSYWSDYLDVSEVGGNVVPIRSQAA
jgi:integrase